MLKTSLLRTGKGSLFAAVLCCGLAPAQNSLSVASKIVVSANGFLSFIEHPQNAYRTFNEPSASALATNPFRQPHNRKALTGDGFAVNRLVMGSLSLQDWKMCSQRLPDRIYNLGLLALQQLNAR